MKRILLLFLTIAALSGTKAQTSYMVNAYLTSPGNPGGLNTDGDGTTTGWTAITPTGGGQSANSWSALETIPFTFEFFGAPVSQFKVSQNGLLTFDTDATALPSANEPLPSANLPDSTICVFWDEFTDAAPTGTNDYVAVKTFGVAPNRQHWIRWFSFEYGNPNSSFNYFAAVLEETTNNIYLVDMNYYNGPITSTVGLQLNSTVAVEYSSNYSWQSGSSGNADNDYIEFVPFTLSAENAALVSINSPSMPACTLDPSVSVTIGNQGSDTLFSVNIGWSVNGVAQPVFAYSDTVVSLATDGPVTIGTFSFNDGDTLMIWVSDPNGNPDGDTSNDTLVTVLRNSLAGTYTIGGAAPDYSTFTQAVNDLNTAGICGSVIFSVADGIYNEQIILSPVVGATDTSTITFRSATGINTGVTLRDSSLASTANYTVLFDGADHFRFENITIRNVGGTYARVLEFVNNADSNIVSGCKLAGNANPGSTSNNFAVIFSASAGISVDSYNLFENNTIEGGSYGAYWYGEGTTTLEPGTRFLNNTFRNNYYRASHLYYQDSPEFSGNIVQTNSASTSAFDVCYFGYCDNQLRITKNNIFTTKYGDGIYLTNCDALAGQKGLIANNMITIGDATSTSAAAGIYLSTSDNQKVLFNNIQNNNGGVSTRGIYVSGLNNEIANNNFVVPNGGYGLYYSSGVIFSNNNNVYLPTNFGYSGGAIATLATWQSTTGFDMNSLTVDPMYHSSNNLHVCNDSLDGAGMAFAEVTTDYDDQVRASIPDIGADEFTGLTNFFVMNDTTKCAGDPVTLDATTLDSSSVYSWSTGDNTPVITTVMQGNIIINVTTFCGVGTDTIMITDIPDPVADFTYQQSFFTAIFNNSSTDATTYLWDFGDGTTSTDVNPIHVYTVSGTYTITLTVTNDCGTDTFTSTFTTSTIGVEELSLNERINVYPNPSQGPFTVSVLMPQSGFLKLELMDINGKIVWNESNENVSGELTLRLENNFPAGMYLLRISTPAGIANKKVTIL